MPRKQLSLTSQPTSHPQLWRFKDLPTEIRIAIWKLAIPKGRVIRLDMDWELDYARTLEMLSIPSILHVCHESREVGTKIYQLGFGTSPTDYDQDWFNPAADTLYIPPWTPPVDWPMGVPYDFTNEFFRRIDFNEASILTHFDSRQHKYLSRVRHLAVPLHSHCWPQMVSPRSFASWLAGFSDLLSLIFVIDHYEMWHRTGELVFYEPQDVAITALSNKHPSEIETEFARSLETYRDQLMPRWDIPTVKVFVMGFKPKEDYFCVPQPSPPTESLE